MVDAIVSPLLKKLKSIAEEEIKAQVKLVVGVDQDVKQLTRNFQAIQAVLNDADRRQVKEETVRLWLDQLKDISYDMEDVLDEWITARMKLRIEQAEVEGADLENVRIEQVEVENALLSLLKVCLSFPTSCFGFKEVVLRRDIALKIKEINQKLNDIVKQKDMFNFDVSVIKSTEKPDRVPSTFLIDESEICGRNDEGSTIISKLLYDSSAEQKSLHIISIVGMGGVGKTTLAQLAYNNEEVKKQFEKFIWVCVSDPFDQLIIARAIIEDLEGSAPNLKEFHALMKKIQELIKGKKFFLVLDDVWNEDYSKWEPFYHCLKSGLHGSKILITTRKESVAQVMRSTDTILIKELAVEECWLLFKRLAFFDRPPYECERLEEIGRKIAGKCKGLPLAAKTIGSLLRFKKTREEWESILNSEMWKLEEFEKGLVAPLLLSYNDLPFLEKRCFSYCAVFPKGYDIDRDRLIKLWMGQGYLREKEEKEMEEIGQECFDILVRHSFFQNFVKDVDDNIVACKMHDIVHDFAQFLSKNECFMVEVNGPDDSFISSSFHNKVCHSRLVLREDGASFPLSICNVKKLRSLFFHGEDDAYSSIGEVLPKLFGELKCLRALEMDGEFPYKRLIREIPEEIGILIHLAYLNLSYLAIEKLPEKVCDLYNLQTLNITGCFYLKELPHRIGKLIHLRHLLNDECKSLRYMPAGIERLACLRTLKVFVVDRGGVHGSTACKLESLKSLSLLEYCEIHWLQNVPDVGEDDDVLVLETLQPPQHLKKLMIRGYGGNTFSLNWMMSLTNVTHLHLADCKNLKHLPPLGRLSSLELLVIKGMKSVKKMGNEFLGIESDRGSSTSSSMIAFPNLKSFLVMDMDALEEWDFEITSGEVEDIRIMPRLSSLCIWDCKKLKARPDYLLHVPEPQTLITREERSNFFDRPSNFRRSISREERPREERFSQPPSNFRRRSIAECANWKLRNEEKLRVALYLPRAAIQYIHARQKYLTTVRQKHRKASPNFLMTGN